jgi:metallo-beta-lactamase family protein
MSIMLKDAAKLQEEEALFAFKRGYSKHAKPEPLFTEADALKVLAMVRSYPMNKSIELLEHVSVMFRNSGHLLGAAFLTFTLEGDTQTKTIVFSGDVGRYGDPIMREPEPLTEADVLIVESTYGDRTNPMGDVKSRLAEVINEAVQHEGCILIPAFAVGRTQTLTYYLHHLMAERRIPTLPIFIDSPMAINATDLYERHASDHKIDVRKERGELISLFDSPNIHFCNTRDQSKALNERRAPAIIISASGMCTGGRILHHLHHRLPRESDTVLFVGYQGEGTRGRDMLEGAPTIRIFGDDVPVKCRIREVHGLSAHGDQPELLRWLGTLTQAPKVTFITHGEEKAATAMAKTITEKLGWNTVVPEYLESVKLFTGI